MSAKRKHPPKRGSDQATLTISLPKDLKRQIEEAAKSDNRNTSNYVANELMKLLTKTTLLVLVGLLGFHYVRCPKVWTAAALKQTAKVAFVKVKTMLPK